MKTFNLKRFSTVSAAVALAAGSLAACGGNEPAIEEAPNSEQTATTDETTSGDDNTDDADDATDDGANDDEATDIGTTDGDQTDGATGGAFAPNADSASEGRDAALAAVDAEHGSGGVVIAQDWDNRITGWDVDVLLNDRVYEVDVNVDGAAIQEDDDVDDDDRTAADVPVTIGDAIDAALENTQGDIDDVNFDDGVWEVELLSDGAEITVYVDSQSGEVLSTERD